MAEESSEKRSFPFLIGIVGPRFPYIWKGTETADAESLCKRFLIRGNEGCVWN